MQTDKRHIKVPQDILLCSTHVDNKKNRFSKKILLSVLHWSPFNTGFFLMLSTLIALNISLVYI